MAALLDFKLLSRAQVDENIENPRVIWRRSLQT